MKFFSKKKETSNDVNNNINNNTDIETAPDHTVIKRSQSIWPVIVCGVALMSDGYVNGVIGTVISLLSTIYPDETSSSNAIQNLGSIAFVGTIVGQLSFGYLSDKFGRKFGMVAASTLIIVFSILCAASSGVTVNGMLTMLIVMRFFLGVGIGAEYPAGSVAASESTQDTQSGHRHGLFVMVTNVAIDVGFVLAGFVPLVLLWIFGTNHLRIVWRGSIALGAIIPLSVFYFRLKLAEPKAYSQNAIKRASSPYWTFIKYYGLRLAAISIIWFIYDFSAYAFGIYASTIIGTIVPNNDLYKNFGWTTVIYLFYIPGAVLGSFGADILTPKWCLITGVVLQAVFGFLMAGIYGHLKNNIGAFCVVYGIFLSFGEFGPGDNIGLIAAKSFPSSMRGQAYAFTAAMGKVGAFAGSYGFKSIIARFGGPDTDRGNSGPFYVASALALVAAIVALLIPNLSQECIIEEDLRWREHLTKNGYDISRLGIERDEAGPIEQKSSNESVEKVKPHTQVE